MLALLKHPLAIALFTLVCLVFSFSLYRSTEQVRQSQDYLIAMEQETIELETSVSQLAEKVEQSSTPFAKEKLIRDQLLMQRPGEYVVQVPELQASESVPKHKAETLRPWHAWIKVLFK